MSCHQEWRNAQQERPQANRLIRHTDQHSQRNEREVMRQPVLKVPLPHPPDARALGERDHRREHQRVEREHREPGPNHRDQPMREIRRIRGDHQSPNFPGRKIGDREGGGIEGHLDRRTSEGDQLHDHERERVEQRHVERADQDQRWKDQYGARGRRGSTRQGHGPSLGEDQRQEERGQSQRLECAVARNGRGERGRAPRRSRARNRSQRPAGVLRREGGSSEFSDGGRDELGLRTSERGRHRIREVEAIRCLTYPASNYQLPRPKRANNPRRADTNPTSFCVGEFCTALQACREVRFADFSPSSLR